MSKRYTKNDIEFIEKMGMKAQSDGYPRIAGQIWGALVVSPEPLSGEELADELQISRGSVSTNTRFLITMGVVELRHIAGDRHDFYGIADEKPYSSIFAVQAKRHASAVSMVKSAQKKSKSPIARKRMAELSDFYSLLSSSFDKIHKEYDK